MEFMEIAGVENLMWLLLWGAVFFFAMNYIEARAAAGKARTGADKASPAPTLESADCMRDPVCGMCADPATDITWIHGERVYYFCSMSCRGRFRSAPEKFLRPVAVISRAGEPHGKA